MSKPIKIEEALAKSKARKHGKYVESTKDGKKVLKFKEATPEEVEAAEGLAGGSE